MLHKQFWGIFFFKYNYFILTITNNNHNKKRKDMNNNLTASTIHSIIYIIKISTF